MLARKLLQNLLKSGFDFDEFLIGVQTIIHVAENRTGWRQAVKKGVRSFEAERLKARAGKRQKQKRHRI